MKWLSGFFRHVTRRLNGKAWAIFALCLALVVLTTTALALVYWEQLQAWEAQSATVRNLAIVAFGVIGLAFAIWRGAVADRQADTAQQSLLYERYQKGSEMLGSKLLSERLSGINALRFLAKEHPEQYHVLISQLLCVFVRHPPDFDKKARLPSDPARGDVGAAMEALGDRNERQIALEKNGNYVPSLFSANLREQSLYNLNLSGMEFGYADLSGAFLAQANLARAHLQETNLAEALMPGANFSDALLLGTDLSRIRVAIGADFSSANFSNANLTDADFSGAILTKAILTSTNLAGALFYKNGLLAEGLTQKQIALTRADPDDRPPTLDGLEDPETGKRIEWSKRPVVK